MASYAERLANFRESMWKLESGITASFSDGGQTFTRRTLPEARQHEDWLRKRADEEIAESSQASGTRNLARFGGGPG